MESAKQTIAYHLEVTVRNTIQLLNLFYSYFIGPSQLPKLQLSTIYKGPGSPNLASTLRANLSSI